MRLVASRFFEKNSVKTTSLLKRFTIKLISRNNSQVIQKFHKLDTVHREMTKNLLYFGKYFVKTGLHRCIDFTEFFLQNARVNFCSFHNMLTAHSLNFSWNQFITGKMISRNFCQIIISTLYTYCPYCNLRKFKILLIILQNDYDFTQKIVQLVRTEHEQHTYIITLL